jgi:hypothetical protein
MPPISNSQLENLSLEMRREFLRSDLSRVKNGKVYNAAVRITVTNVFFFI